MTKQTKGQYRVGIDFNPSNSDLVARIKLAATDFIDLVDEIPVTDLTQMAWVAPIEQQAHEKNRLKALAQTSIEEAAMWAVKAATKPEPK